MIDLHNYFYYDESSPSGLRWAVDRYSGKGYKIKCASKGDVAGAIGKSGYYSVRYNKKLTLCHTIIMALFNKVPKSNECIDHLDGNRLNNTLRNLRIIAKEQNARNAKKRKDNSSGVGGVYRLKNNVNGVIYILWRATWVGIDGKLRNKSFSVLKYGENVAKQKAVDFRRGMITLLNKQSAGYTLRHNT